MKLVFAAAFVLILGSLFSALYYMVRGSGDGDGRRMVRALAFRIGFSVLLFAGLLIAHRAGWIGTSGFGG